MSDEALGKGRTSIFRSTESVVQTTPSEQPTPEIELPSAKVIDPTILQQAIDEASIKSKITLWNPDVSAVLRYVQLTTVRYSMSKDASRLLEKTVKRTYPDVWKAVQKNRKH